MKRKDLYLLGLIVIVFIGVMAVIQNDVPDIKPFDVGEYRYYIDNFSSEESLRSVSDIKDLLKKVEEIWIRKYGEGIKKEKPYQVFYDEKEGVWLVRGTLRPNLMGGAANILVMDATGEVLAVWHEK